jgi:hypothetical protein
MASIHRLGPTSHRRIASPGAPHLRALDSWIERPWPIQMGMTRSGESTVKMRHVGGLTNGDCLVALRL